MHLFLDNDPFRLGQAMQVGNVYIETSLYPQHVSHVVIHAWDAIELLNNDDETPEQAEKLERLMSGDTEFLIKDQCGNVIFPEDDGFNQACAMMIAQASAYYRNQSVLTASPETFYGCSVYGDGSLIGVRSSKDMVLVRIDLLGSDDLPVGSAVKPFEFPVPDGYTPAIINTENTGYAAIEIESLERLPTETLH